MKAVFIMSSERSGSNLLRAMLDFHSQFSGPPAVHLPRILSPYLPYYGDLSDNENLITLIRDAIAIVQTHKTPWDVDLTVDAVRCAVEERSLWGVIAGLYRLNAVSRGKSGWVCKSNQLFNYAYPIRESLPDARFIYLVRDGRDYVASMRRVAMDPIHVYPAARVWRNEQQACLEVYADLRRTGVVHLVRYEDLLLAPKEVLRGVCAFLDSPFEPGMLNFHHSDSARAMARSSALWHNLEKPLLQNNFGKFRLLLTSRQIRLIEATIGLELILLGYPRLTRVPVEEPGQLRRAWYEVVNQWWVWRRRRRQKQSDPWREARRRVIAGIRRRLVAQGQPLEDVRLLRKEQLVRRSDG